MSMPFSFSAIVRSISRLSRNQTCSHSSAMTERDSSRHIRELRPIMNGDFPLAWAKMYGKGRVFYSSLGHDAKTWDNPDVYRMYFEAIKWALGLTNADVTPRPLTVAAGAQK
jgi:type 1 glutamine amidotransferase